MKKKKAKEKAKEILEDEAIQKIFSEPSEKAETTEAENIRLIIKEWLNLAHIKMKTRFTTRSARAVTTLQGLADKYNIETLDDYLLEYRINRLSIDGESSRELTEILKARIPDIQQDGLKELSKYLE